MGGLGPLARRLCAARGSLPPEASAQLEGASRLTPGLRTLNRIGRRHPGIPSRFTLGVTQPSRVA